MDSTLLQLAVEKVIGKSPQLYGFHHLGGGEINQSYKVLTDHGVYFMKVHESGNYPRLFDREVFALNALAKTHTVDVAKPVGTCLHDGKEFLFLDYIESGPANANYWGDFGENLARLHQNSSRYFGFQEDNFINTLLQLNNRVAKWGQFFVANRLLPNVRKAIDQHYMEPHLMKSFEKYFRIAEEAFPEEAPALLHGNLWKEHILVNAGGDAILVNPSSYYGHREMDLAMTTMVGSFEPTFYEAYQATYPLQPDWEIRTSFCQMYYALVNLNLYGRPYWPNVQELLNKWVNL